MEKEKIVLAISMLLFGFAFGILITQINPPMLISQPEKCTNLTLKETSDCLHKELTGFFNYNITNLYERLSEEELKESGGVCKHYSKWYASNMEQLGFTAEEFTFDVGEGRHKITIASTEGEYCVLDQTLIPVCHNLREPHEKS